MPEPSLVSGATSNPDDDVSNGENRPIVNCHASKFVSGSTSNPSNDVSNGENRPIVNGHVSIFVSGATSNPSDDVSNGENRPIVNGHASKYVAATASNPSDDVSNGENRPIVNGHASKFVSATRSNPSDDVSDGKNLPIVKNIQQDGQPSTIFNPFDDVSVGKNRPIFNHLRQDGQSSTIFNPSDDVSDGKNRPIVKNLHQDVHHASKFKGVVCQQNGHWGSQIYANHQRVWLGTFKSESEAAMAYDSAAIMLRNGDTHRNFPWTDITRQEPNFQSQFTTELVLAMIKDGSYASKFSDFLRARVEDSYNNLANFHGGFNMRLLFQKELTPSDVSKLNRLVIPKKYAVKFFPRFPEEQDGGGSNDVELAFYDRSGRQWKFRYCYWKSSQSYVFTRGWNKFAKEKELRPRDRVIFSAFEGLNEVRKLWVIDVEYSDGERVGGNLDGNAGGEEEIDDEAAVELKIGQSDAGFDEKENEGIEDEDAHRGLLENADELSNTDDKKGFMLFGVWMQ